MKKFNFRLQSVLNLKEHALSDAEAKMLEQENILLGEQNTMKGLVEEKNYIRKQKLSFVSSMNFVMMEISQKFEISIDLKIKASEIRLQEIAKVLKKCKEAYSEAKKELKIYEKLKEKSKEEYRLDMLAYEQKFLDDINSIKTFKSLKETAE